MKPCHAKTVKQGETLKETTVHTKDSWLLFDYENGRILICNQREGHYSTGKVSLKKAEFDKMVSWYQTNQRTWLKA